MDNAKVPWKYSYSLILAAEGTQTLSAEIDKRYPIEDAVSGTVTLAPGESISGLVSLNNRFRSLSEAAAKQDVIVFWSYQAATVDGVKAERCGGWVLIARSHSSAAAQ